VHAPLDERYLGRADRWRTERYPWCSPPLDRAAGRTHRPLADPADPSTDDRGVTGPALVVEIDDRLSGLDRLRW
jgi:hypothetical protein